MLYFIYFIAFSKHVVLDIIKSNRDVAARVRSQPYHPRAIEPPKTDQITVIIGPRRAGKSTYAIHEYPQATYLNFDDERLTSNNTGKVIDAIQEQEIILDEIQNIEKWELLVNRLQREGKRLIITGSNAHLLSGELATHLTGRYTPITLLPLSAQELKRPYTQYAQTGGYPEIAINKQDLISYTTTLLEATIYKDIVKRKNIRYATTIEKLAKYLYQTTGRELSTSNVAKELTIESNHTIRKYLAALKESFLFFYIEKHTKKARKKLAPKTKPYAIDISGILCFAPDTPQGMILENTVAIELLRRNKNITYWKNQHHEIDFYDGENIIQVSYTLTDNTTKKRELLGLINAAQELPHKQLTIITTDKSSQEKFEWFEKKYTITIQNIDEFLQEKQV